MLPIGGVYRELAKLVLPIGGVYRELDIWVLPIGGVFRECTIPVLTIGGAARESKLRVLTIWRGTDREFNIRGQLLGECRTRVRDTVAPDKGCLSGARNPVARPCED